MGLCYFAHRSSKEWIMYKGNVYSKSFIESAAALDWATALQVKVCYKKKVGIQKVEIRCFPPLHISEYWNWALTKWINTIEEVDFDLQ